MHGTAVASITIQYFVESELLQPAVLPGEALFYIGS
jgi:hypothetical protein